MILKKKIPASACRKKKIACSTNVIESLWEKKGEKYPAHRIARKKILDDQKSPTSPPQELNGRPLKVFITGNVKVMNVFEVLPDSPRKWPQHSFPVHF